MSDFSDMLVYLRKREKLSQQELADRTGLTRSAVSMYETAKREPDLETFEIFADFFNVDMNTLTGKTALDANRTSAKNLPTQEGEEVWKAICADRTKLSLAAWIAELKEDDLRKVAQVLAAILGKELPPVDPG